MLLKSSDIFNGQCYLKIYKFDLSKLPCTTMFHLLTIFKKTYLNYGDTS